MTLPRSCDPLAYRSIGILQRLADHVDGGRSIVLDGLFQNPLQIGRVFDPDVGGGAGSSTGVVAMPVGGNVLDPRPRVSDVFPTGGNWPVNVPVVVVFTESMSRESVAPALGDPLVYLSLAGTDLPIPAQVASHLARLSSSFILKAPLMCDLSG